MKPDEVADYFLLLAREHGDYLSHLKLQKLIYYADSWHLVNFGKKPLVEEEFEAWVHGPVLRSLYNRFRDYGWQPILEEVSMPKVSKKQEKHLREVYEVFGGLSAFELEKMTHDEEPWLKARKGLAPDESSNNRIKKSVMYSFYKSVADEED